MAAFYWVLGSGNISDAEGHIATESGGAPAAANIPATGDQMIFDGLSADADYVVTIDDEVRADSFAVSGPYALTFAYPAGDVAIAMATIPPSDGSLVSTIAPAASPLLSFEVGSSVELTMLFTDASGSPIQPATVEAWIVSPASDDPAALSPQMITPGFYRVIYQPAVVGLHQFRYKGSGDILSDVSASGAFMATEAFEEPATDV